MATKAAPAKRVKNAPDASTDESHQERGRPPDPMNHQIEQRRKAEEQEGWLRPDPRMDCQDVAEDEKSRRSHPSQPGRSRAPRSRIARQARRFAT